jgi:two-component system NtrC family sensor kinase
MEHINEPAGDIHTGAIETSGGPPSDPATPAVEEGLLAAQEALLGRPRLSIRTRLIASLALCFLCCVAFALGSFDVMNKVNIRLHVLQTVERLDDRILRVRALADEGLLSKTDLERVVERTDESEALLAMQPITPVVEAAHVLPSLLRLSDLCRRLLDAPGGQEGRRSTVGLLPSAQAIALRTTAVEASERLEQMIRTERRASARSLHYAALAPLVLLAVLFALFVVITIAFTRALDGPIQRFKGYTARIAHGDFSFLRPARGYQDEFSDLTIAVNRMLAELRMQQDRVVKGAKLALVGTLTAGIAHEINNPINNISITTEALMEGATTFSEEDRWRHLQDIYFETERMSEIVKSLLDFTRREKLDTDLIDVPDLLHSTIRLVQNEMKVHNVSLVDEIPPDLPRIRGTVNQLRQVFLNLLLNGIQAMPAGGVISVRASIHGTDKVRIAVHDSGTGIAADLLPRIFDPFFTTKEPGKGTGLGLSISLSIVRKFGGDIQVTSEPGRGTSFHVYLPHESGVTPVRLAT